jgi:ribose-phosphate pyrophosphokinase
VAVTHGLFVDDAVAQIHAAGVRHIWSTDCVPHASNVVSVVPLLAQALRELAAVQPASQGPGFSPSPACGRGQG